MSEDLKKNGFVLLKNVISPEEIEFAKNAIQPDGVDYEKIWDYARKSVLDRIDNEMGWNTICTKFRMSDNNNSADASTLHRDLIVAKGIECPPVFTCLSYLDKTRLEVVPGSHLKTEMSYSEAFDQYNNRQIIEINPGDILFFYATLLHRGIFYDNIPRRRLLQLFDVFPNQEAYDQYNFKIAHIPAEKNENQSMIKFKIAISKIPFIINFLNYFAYLNAATGYGNPTLDSFDYFSSENTQERLEMVPGTLQKINIYIIMEDSHFIDGEDKKKVGYTLFAKAAIRHILIVLIFILIVIYLIYKMRK